MDPIDFIVVALATWRLTSLLVWEAGPWDVLFRLRHFFGVRYDEQSARYSNHVVGKALICPWCASVWVGLASATLYLTFPASTMMVCLPLALSAVVVLLEKAVSHGEG